MKLHYYPETDSLYYRVEAELGQAPHHEVADNLVIDFDAGDVVGI